MLDIHTDKGVVKGVTGAKPSHIATAEEAKLAIPLSELYVDVGTASREEAEALGVTVGDFVTFSREGQFLNGGKVFTGKAVDDRSGCAVLLEVMKRLAGKQRTASVYAVGSVQALPLSPFSRTLHWRSMSRSLAERRRSRRK